MANEQNLIKSGDLTPKERRESASKAGKASAASRRRKKTMREAAQVILSMPCREGEPDDAEYMSDLFKRNKRGKVIIDKKTGKPIPKNLTVEQASLISIAEKAMNGDVKALEFLRDTAGEKPANQVELTTDIAQAASELSQMLAEMDDDG